MLHFERAPPYVEVLATRCLLGRRGILKVEGIGCWRVKTLRNRLNNFGGVGAWESLTWETGKASGENVGT